MKGAATRAVLCAKGNWAGARLPSRAMRLAGESGARPGFAALADWPEWLALTEDRRERVGAIAALLGARDALVAEIDGSRLRAYARVVGGDALEAIVALDEAGSATLPPPEALPALSAGLLAASLYPDVAVLAGFVPRHDPAAAALVRRAESLCRSIPPR